MKALFALAGLAVVYMAIVGPYAPWELGKILDNPQPRPLLFLGVAIGLVMIPFVFRQQQEATQDLAEDRVSQGIPVGLTREQVIQEHKRSFNGCLVAGLVAIVSILLIIVGVVKNGGLPW